ncbi:phage portal protein [Candidatus Parcubacteria bacterium]|nr:MAG: phage portal protein [Candidatus Parcubacteria bacterium]
MELVAKKLYWISRITSGGFKVNLPEASLFDIRKVQENPNPDDTKLDLWYKTIANLYTLGKAYWFICRDQLGAINEIWPLETKYLYEINDGMSSRLYYSREGQKGFEIPYNQLCTFTFEKNEYSDFQNDMKSFIRDYNLWDDYGEACWLVAHVVRRLDMCMEYMSKQLNPFYGTQIPCKVTSMGNPFYEKYHGKNNG